jgi:glutamate synthase domain-containing protein 1
VGNRPRGRPQGLGWRDVPVDRSVLGYSVVDTEPMHRQVFIGRGPTIRDEAHFERKLFVCRKVVSNRVVEVLGKPRPAPITPSRSPAAPSSTRASCSAPKCRTITST